MGLCAKYSYPCEKNSHGGTLKDNLSQGFVALPGTACRSCFMLPETEAPTVGEWTKCIFVVSVGPRTLREEQELLEPPLYFAFVSWDGPRLRIRGPCEKKAIGASRLDWYYYYICCRWDIECW